MTTRSDFLADLRKQTRAIRNDVQKNFYFLEMEDLRYRPAKNKWTIAEIFAHINLVQSFYLKNIATALDKAEEVNHDEVHFSWIGKKLTEGLTPKEGVIRFKVPTFPKLDPVRRSKKGVAIKEQVIFSDFIADMEQLEEVMIKAYDYDISAIKVNTFLPLLKLNIADALTFNLAHTERHVLQARKVLEGKETAHSL